MHAFNPLTVPLFEPQAHLIEASAGTGKTYGIAALFTRLVLQGVPVEQILVVTFTEAATAELKTRLRARLGEAAACLQAEEEDKAAGDALLQDLLAQASAQHGRDVLAARVQAALSGFDTAAIYTIHGFCLRVLSDYAFLCGVPFELTVGDADPAARLLAAQDFWREEVADHPLHAELAAEFKLTPASVLAELSPYLKRPFLDAVMPENRLPELLADYEAAWAAVRDALPQLEAGFRRLHPQLNKRTFNGKTFDTLFAELAQAAESGLHRRSFSKPENLLKFEAGYLKDAVNKGKEIDEAEAAGLAPLAEFGRCFLAIDQAKAEAVVRLKLACWGYLNRRLAEDKQRRAQRDFDDLLLDVHTALTEGSRAADLAEALAQKWRVALIDEFQDTDPLQYAVFKTAFIDRGLPVFLVGDPKQAIYGFRGADIHAYLDAAADTPSRYTLATNYRSSRAVVDGIGRLFSRRAAPFVLADIPYVPVAAHRTQGALQPPGAAVTVRWINPPAGADDKLPSKDVLHARAADFCAREIADRLNRARSGSLLLDGRPLEPQHIAVLVRTHNEAALAARALKKRGVRSVLLQQESVFDSEEARAFGVMLSFWLHPQHTENLRFLLGSVLYGRTAADLAALNENEAALAGWIALAEDARNLWQQQGVYAATARFARASGLEAHLLATRNERSLTNFWQLAELAAEAAADLPAPAALPEWLARQAGRGIGKERMLRLESDENLVKIVTMHAAKGLEYPLVFCPFVWDASSRDTAEWALLHQDNGRSLLLARTQLTEAHQEQLFAEAMGERLRLLYVALTRAREELVLYAAACNSTADNALAYLLAEEDGDCHRIRAGWQALKNQALAETLKQAWQSLISAAPSNDLQWREDEPPEADYRAADPMQGRYRACTWPPRPWRFIRHTSFTGLTRQAATAEDGLPEQDWLEHQSAAPAGESEAVPETALLAFPRGARAGVCLHAVLEHTDFNRPAVEQAEAYADILRGYGYDPDSHLAAALEMAAAAAAAELDTGATLADTLPAERLPETGFVLHIEDFGLPRLQRWFARSDTGLPPHAADHLAALDFHTVNGFLNGFIDLIARSPQGRVWVIDYKSNHLGKRLRDYHPEAMSAAVSEHHYYLQALIYAVAAARYLKQRRALPDTIAIRYLFLRGLNPHGTEGIWRWDIPTAALAEWLD